MSNRDNNRVLSRLGSRELTPEEVAIVAKSEYNTNILTCCSDVTGDGHQ